MTADDDQEPVGSLSEEAARLFAALSGAAREQGAGLGDGVVGLGDRIAEALHDVDDHLATGGADCRYCPVCRAVDLVRRTDPDVAQHLADAAQSLTRAVAALLATDNVGARARKATVEHIDLDGSVDLPDLDETDPQQEEHR